jgi:hypothetical protein
LSDIRESMEKYQEPFSEQAPNRLIGGSPEITLPMDHARLVFALLQNAAWRVGGVPPGLGWGEELEYILKHATRSRAILPGQYQLAWWLLAQIKKQEHVIIDQVAKPGFIKDLP